MSNTRFFLERLSHRGPEVPALVDEGGVISYGELWQRVLHWQRFIADSSISPGDSVALCGDYSVETCALLLALLPSRCVVVPMTQPPGPERDRQLAKAEVRWLFEFAADGSFRGLVQRNTQIGHPLLVQLSESRETGLVLFSSGSSGESKASLLSFERLLARFRKPRPAFRTLAFLLLDHIGGLNTILHTLANGGTLVPVTERSPEAICAAIAQHRIQLLPTTPTFLNMLLISSAWERYDLSSLEVVTYGTEPMPPSTLRHLTQVFPWIRFKQTYGLSELGILHTRSKSNDSLLMQAGGDGYELKVVDGVLWIRAESAMLGYLNAPSPVDEEGWFNTGDAVEVEGEYIRILGRESELINVGGEKVYPAEVESVLLEIDNVADGLVTGRPNPVTGQVVVAKVRLERPEDGRELTRRVRLHCRSRLAPFKVPVFVEVADGELHGHRFKRMRSPAASSPMAESAGAVG